MVVSSIEYWGILRIFNCLSINFTLSIWLGGNLGLVERLDSSLCFADSLVLLSGNLLYVNYVYIRKITGSPGKGHSIPHAIHWACIVVD